MILGIESSCDETAAAVCSKGQILASVISSQEIHASFGGVVPEIASREHERLLNSIVDTALQQAGVSLSGLSGIAVTQGPGLAGTLLTGAMFAKGLALGLDLPVVGVNHLEAHIFANFLADPTLEFPFICLLVSGGHTQLWNVNGVGDYVLLGNTRDDAAGEAFDKGARILGLGYPGGPAIERAAETGDENAIQFPRSFMKPGNYEFSFSGLKTSLLYFMKESKNQEQYNLATIAASYEKAIVDVLTYKLSQAVKSAGVSTAVVAGGVAANKRLRASLADRLPSSVRLLYPDFKYCTDNAAMVSYLGEIKLKAGQQSPLDFDIIPNLRLD
ncbi:MAG: tRNA (adenosine(37)-N6)-threonylcarbamoyltransferase complex transferase subunit TsaD [Fidelibacterota bacterium]